MAEPSHVRVSLTKAHVAACLDALNWNIAKQRWLAQRHGVTVIAEMHEERQRQAEGVAAIFQALLMRWPNA